MTNQSISSNWMKSSCLWWHSCRSSPFCGDHFPATKPSYQTPQLNLAATLSELIPRRVWIFGSLDKKVDSSGSGFFLRWHHMSATGNATNSAEPKVLLKTRQGKTHLGKKTVLFTSSPMEDLHLPKHRHFFSPQSRRPGTDKPPGRSNQFQKNTSTNEFPRRVGRFFPKPGTFTKLANKATQKRIKKGLEFPNLTLHSQVDTTWYKYSNNNNNNDNNELSIKTVLVVLCLQLSPQKKH